MHLPLLCTRHNEGEPVDAEIPPEIGGFVERQPFQFRADYFWVVTRRGGGGGGKARKDVGQVVERYS